MKKVKTTAIEKKYKDKKTGEYKSLTINHAKVKDRLMAFWEENPNGKIETKPTIMQNGQVMFQCNILRDKSNPTSREATAHAMGVTTDDKSFEKLETISVGRCLALLGYATDGEIASSEEMEEFNEYKKRQKEESIMLAIETLDTCKSMVELKTIWASLGNVISEPEVIAKKDELKLTLK